MDKISKEVRSRNMAAIKGKNTAPELYIKHLVRSLRYKHRFNLKNLPGKPDILLRNRNTVIFVHGCFWHQHPGCRYAAKPKSNKRFWKPKLKGNRERDKKNYRELRGLGYNIITVWECEIKKVLKKGNSALVKKLKKDIK